MERTNNPVIMRITRRTKISSSHFHLNIAISVIISTMLIYGDLSSAAPIAIESENQAMVYLSQFGWLDPSSKKVGTEALIDLRKSISEFQSFAGLNVTGELNTETIELMSTPRCGVRDKIGHDARRRKRYALQGSRWTKRALTYRISKYPKVAETIGKSVVDDEIAQAFRVWEEHANITFSKRTTETAHIEIRFEKGEHGDGDAFDGEGGTLAHAYFPVYGGDAHFDDQEKWTVKSTRGTNLFQVAAHEIGHSLGLSHTDVRSALMAPFYRGYQANFKLGDDDIQAIQALYGKKAPGVAAKVPLKPTKKPDLPKPQRPSGTVPRPTTSSNSQLCSNPRIDALTTMSDENTYAFKGSNVYRLTTNGVAPGFPQSIQSSVFKDLPSYIDSAFTWSNDKTYFFKGPQYWRYTNMKLDTGYPKPISDGFAGIPANIDTAFVWSGNGKIYFFKGDKYWRFDPLRSPPVSPGYPKPISNWNGIPDNIDAALRYSNGFTYFFKGNKYWRFNDRTFGVDTADPPFPRTTGDWWFGCKRDTMKSSESDYQDDQLSDNSDAGERSRGSSDVILTSSRCLLTNISISVIASLLPFLTSIFYYQTVL